MRQNKTKQMLQYWLDLLEAANIGRDSDDHSMIWPERSDLQPSDCRSLLGDMFILEPSSKGDCFRLAGTRLCSLHGRELKKEVFTDMFDGADKRSIKGWLEGLAIEDYVVLICSQAKTDDGYSVTLETLLLPLNNNGARGERVAGITVPCDNPWWIGAHPITSQSIQSIRVIRPWENSVWLSNWPFKNPEQVNLRSIEDVQPLETSQVEAPSLEAQLEELVEKPMFSPVRRSNDSPARKVAHLTVFDGGKRHP